MQNSTSWDWFGRVGEHVRRVVRRKVAASVRGRPREREVISDMTQEALAAAAERFDKFRGTTEAQFVAWVSAIAEHKLCDHRRAMRRQRRDVRRTRPLAAVGDEVPQAAPLPHERLLLDEERKAVALLVDRLPWRYRTAIRLRYFEEQPVAVVAAALRCSETAAQGVLKRALVWLRRVAGEGDYDAFREPSSRQLQRPK